MRTTSLITLAILALAWGQPLGSATAGEDKVPKEGTEWCNIWVSNANKDNLPRVLFIGDSITQAYFNRVEKHLAGKATCARVTTSTSIGAPSLLLEVELLLKHFQFKVVHVNNGMHGWFYSEEQYSQAFEPFMKAIMKQADGARFIWAHTTPVMKDGNADNELTERVKIRNQTAGEFASRNRIPVNDLFGLVVEHPEYYSADGVHFNKLGIETQAKQVADYVLKSLEDE